MTQLEVGGFISGISKSNTQTANGGFLMGCGISPGLAGVSSGNHQPPAAPAALPGAKAWRGSRCLYRCAAADVPAITSLWRSNACAQSAARALLDNTDMEARDIVEKGLGIAADICIYTNHNRTIEEL